MSTRLIQARSNFGERQEAGIKTIGQLVQKTECEILRIHDLGEKSLHQIKKAIAKYGYALRSEKVG